jgi:hypothetical protein
MSDLATTAVIIFISALSIALNASAFAGKQARIVPGLIGTAGTSFWIYKLNYSLIHIIVHLLLISALSLFAAHFLKRRLTV